MAGSTAEISSTARMELKKDAPTPPYSTGISMPRRPRSKSCAMRAGLIFCASSISRTSGAILLRANLRTVSWRSCSSAVRVERGAMRGFSVASASMNEGISGKGLRSYSTRR